MKSLLVYKVAVLILALSQFFSFSDLDFQKTENWSQLTHTEPLVTNTVHVKVEIDNNEVNK